MTLGRYRASACEEEPIQTPGGGGRPDWVRPPFLVQCNPIQSTSPWSGSQTDVATGVRLDHPIPGLVTQAKTNASNIVGCRKVCVIVFVFLLRPPSQRKKARPEDKIGKKREATSLPEIRPVTDPARQSSVRSLFASEAGLKTKKRKTI